jgi:hypothetical protein
VMDLSDVESIRPALIVMCRNPLARVNPPNLDLQRHRWKPFTVRDPQSLSLFTDAGAWDFISDCLESGGDVTCKPPSAEHPDHAYVMISNGGGSRRIYMKIAIKPGLRKLIGVSFHYAVEEQDG